MTIQEALQLFINDSLIQGKSEATIANYKNCISCVSRTTTSLTQNGSLEEMTTENLNKFFIYGLTERKWRKFTAWTYYKNLLAFFNWAIRKKLIESNPLKDIPKPRLQRQPPKALTEFEVVEILKTMESQKYFNEFIKIRNIAIIKTFLFTGIRKKELLNLKYEDVDFDSDFIYIRDGKGGKSREVPIGRAHLRPILIKYIELRNKYYDPVDWFFKGEPSTGFSKGKRLSETVLKGIFSHISRLLHKRIYAHRLRHTFATLLLEKTGDIYVLKELLGHSDIKNTTIYLSTTRQKKVEAISRLKLIES